MYSRRTVHSHKCDNCGTRYCEGLEYSILGVKEEEEEEEEEEE